MNCSGQRSSGSSRRQGKSKGETTQKFNSVKRRKKKKLYAIKKRRVTENKNKAYLQIEMLARKKTVVFLQTLNFEKKKKKQEIKTRHFFVLFNTNN